MLFSQVQGLTPDWSLCHCQLRVLIVSSGHCQWPVNALGLEQLTYASTVFPMGHCHVTTLLMDCWHCQRQSPSSWCHCQVCEFVSPGFSCHCQEMSLTGICCHCQVGDPLSQRQEAPSDGHCHWMLVPTSCQDQDPRDPCHWQSWKESSASRWQCQLGCCSNAASWCCHAHSVADKPFSWLQCQLVRSSQLVSSSTNCWRCRLRNAGQLLQIHSL